MVKGCSTLFASLEEANQKALELANEMLSQNLLVHDKYVRVENGGPTAVVSSNKLRQITSKEQLRDLAEEFDFILSTSVIELFEKQELIPE